MRFLSRLFKKLPMVESIRAAAEGWGALPYIVSGVCFAGALAMSAWAWVESHVPLWLVATIFLFIVVLGLGAVNFSYGIYVKRKTSLAVDNLVEIDRETLAEELADCSRRIATLIGEFRGPMQEAWWSEAGTRDPMAIRGSHGRIEGQMIDRYSSRHGADVWMLIRRASKIVTIDQSEVWQISHGVRSEHDLTNLYMFLASLSDDVRTPKLPLPMTDRRREQMLARSAPPVPQLPSEPAP